MIILTYPGQFDFGAASWSFVGEGAKAKGDEEINLPHDSRALLVFNGGRLGKHAPGA
jgi:hypothetical protein